MHFVKEYFVKNLLLTSPESPSRCLIFDDTDITKTGKTIEGVSNIFNHVNKTFHFGFKLLVAGYWNGSIFIPVDFSFHRENKNSKNKYGLTSKKGFFVVKKPKPTNDMQNCIKRKQMY